MRAIEEEGKGNGMYDFRNQVRRGIRDQTTEKIQALWPFVHQDVLTMLNIGCESFRVELETQINWVSNIQ